MPLATGSYGCSIRISHDLNRAGLFLHWADKPDSQPWVWIGCINDVLWLGYPTTPFPSALALCSQGASPFDAVKKESAD